MNPFRLRTYHENPPGGYMYRQFGPVRRDFPSDPVIETLANNVSAFRRGNNLPRSSFIESLEDVDRQNCKRINNDPRWCYESPDPFTSQNTSTFQTKGCQGCGAKVE